MKLNNLLCLLLVISILSCNSAGNEEVATEQVKEEVSTGQVSKEAIVHNLTIKTSENDQERQAILDAARPEVKREVSGDVLFVVNHLIVADNYAWLEVTVVDKNGHSLQLENEELDCCHAEGLFRKKDGQWQAVVFNSFSTDCWFCGISSQYPEVNPEIFSAGARAN